MIRHCTWGVLFLELLSIIFSTSLESCVAVRLGLKTFTNFLEDFLFAWEVVLQAGSRPWAQVLYSSQCWCQQNYGSLETGSRQCYPAFLGPFHPDHL